MSIMIDGVGDGHWHITPDPATGMIELALEVRGRRFAGQVSSAELPAVEQLLTGLPDARADGDGTQVDLSGEFIRVIGRDPFVEQAVDRRPWYRKMVRSTS